HEREILSTTVHRKIEHPTVTRSQQIPVPQNGDKFESVTLYSPDIFIDLQDHELLHTRLQQLCPAGLLPNQSHASCCPCPILVSVQHQELMKNTNEALVAQSPKRMPLTEKKGGSSARIFFPGRLGSWRPDFLIEQNEAGNERLRISEINTRFSFNGLMHDVYVQQAMRDIGVNGEHNGLFGTIVRYDHPKKAPW
ncbi:uncharacterized protein N7529_005727, partial [Penicillium soppii]|uniref:uncharacterized protein n=1 Tax=Penicillium soppii TaxID=69789 RepID=UPI002548E025